ncbi:hypothetical protein BV25DRAFT_1919504 [Artomyces pyxidatus]|uniref:Uncharacterized protein n=1 Tax=Artomyces pyxidatus TaxID=48021 RepID=A0ACB8SPG0_9AGAM|nr:hypothetical protein BV25DRAFT_1919504 [Artomyces pyxidatus]
MHPSAFFVGLIVIMSLVALQEKVNKNEKNNAPLLKGAPRPDNLPGTAPEALSSEDGGENGTVANAHGNSSTFMNSTMALPKTRGTESGDQKSSKDGAA